MLERKLIVDRYFNFPVEFYSQIPPAAAAGAFQGIPWRNYFLQESTGIFTKTSAVQAGRSLKEHRNFLWLPYAPGAITEIPLQGTDVLSGPMSGCWLITYRKPNGIPCVAHVGTVDSAVDPRTVAVKAAWNRFAGGNQWNIVGGFNPLASWPALPAPRGHDSVAAVFGLCTASNEFYTVFLYRQVPGTPGLARVAGIRRIFSAPRHALQRI